MKRLIITLFAIGFITVLGRAQTAIVWSHPTQGEGLASSLSEAVQQAPDGSTIYLSGGVFEIGDVVVNKKLTIIGAGHYPDSTTQATGTTVLSGNIKFVNGSSGSFLTGVWLNGNLYIAPNSGDSLNNITITRCRLNYVDLTGADTSYTQDIVFEDNVIGASYASKAIDGHDRARIIAKKNIFNGFINEVDNSQFWNNVFLASNCTGLLYLCNYDNFYNNIFYGNSTSYVSYEGGNLIFYNNLIMSGINQTNGNYYNSIIVSSADSIFVNYNGGSFSYSHDFHLVPYSPGKNAGTDGTDVGIYGTNNPYNPVPFNPHIYYSEVKMNSDGTLRLKIGAYTQGAKK